MVPLDSQRFESFIAAKSAAAVHFDAEWNSSYRAVTRRQMRETELIFLPNVRSLSVITAIRWGLS